MNSYIKNGDLEGLVIVKQSNLETYGNEFGMSLEQALDKYGSYQEVINATVGSNPGVDACTGMYGFEEEIQERNISYFCNKYQPVCE